MELNGVQREFIKRKLEILSKSQFRSKFKLNEKDYNYLKEKGLQKIEEHAKDFIQQRLAPKNIKNDGKQTPMRGHPVFVAQHATATCCRGCLYKWYHIPKNRELLPKEKNFVLALIMEWLNKNYKLK